MNNLQSIRDAIDAIDKSLLQLIAKRLQLAQDARPHKETVKDAVREEELRTLWAGEAKESGLSEDFAKELLECILTESRRIQQNP